MVGQQVILSGKVTDSIQNPLTYANIIAKPQDQTKALKFAISDDYGRFRLGLNSSEKYEVTISYLGYRSASFEIQLIDNRVKNIILTQLLTELDEVVIKLPVTVKEDTIIYNTDKFISGNERKLKHVLDKLPGVEVMSNGEVQVNGKKVTHMLVEGNKFFGGGSKLAVDNIPANAIDQVHVLDNYSEIAFLKGLTDADQMAMDIKLKADKKKFVFGDLESGKGHRNYYRIHSNTFYYSPETNLNVIGNLNNTNETTFTFKDYLQFQNGMSSFLMYDGSALNSIQSNLVQFMKSPNVVKSNRQFAAINLRRSFNDKLEISGYAIVSNSASGAKEESIKSYVIFEEEHAKSEESDNILGIAKFDLKYSPKSDQHVNFRMLYEKSEDEIDSYMRSIINEQSQFVQHTINTGTSKFEQNLEWHKRLSRKHTFSIAAELTHGDRYPRNVWRSDKPIFQSIMKVEESDEYKIVQQIATNEINASLRCRHYWVLNNSNHLYTTLGNSFSDATFLSNDRQEQENGDVPIHSGSSDGKNTDFTINDLFIGFHHKFKKGILTMKHGAFLHNYHWKIQQTSDVINSKIVLLPDLTVGLKFSNSNNLKMNYQLRSSFTDISFFSDDQVLQSYNSVSTGNKYLENELIHAAQLFYNRFSLYRGIMVFGQFSIFKKIRGIKRIVRMENYNQHLSYTLAPSPEARISLNFGLDKTTDHLKYRFSLVVSRNSFVQSVNKIDLKRTSENLAAKFSVQTRLEKFPNIELGIRQSYGRNGHLNFHQTEPFFKLDYPFSEAAKISIDYKYRQYKNAAVGINSKRQIANAAVLFQKEDSPWYFKLNAKNLFDSSFINHSSITELYESETKSYIMPRIIMLSIGYEL